MVEVSELVAQFVHEPEAAAQRYRGQVLRIQGEVARFQPGLFNKNYEVLLVTPARDLMVKCHFSYLDQYDSVYTTQEGRLLVGHRNGYQDHPLLKIGDAILLQGRCKGAKSGVITFAGCALTR